jgi:hypothetical protein
VVQGLEDFQFLVGIIAGGEMIVVFVGDFEGPSDFEVFMRNLEYLPECALSQLLSVGV